MRKNNTVNTKRPINLDLMTLKFPPMAIASILHRLSGVILFLFTPVLLYFLGQSLHSKESFQSLIFMLEQPHWKILLWVFAAAITYHLLAGVRHMIMDLGFGEGLKAGRNSALFTIILTLILSIILGFWIW